MAESYAKDPHGTERPGVKVVYEIWVRGNHSPNETGLLRTIIPEGPVGAAFEQAMKYMRDEGWVSVEVVRQRMVNK